MKCVVNLLSSFPIQGVLKTFQGASSVAGNAQGRSCLIHVKCGQDKRARLLQIQSNPVYERRTQWKKRRPEF
jgi:hypothetical protein